MFKLFLKFIFSFTVVLSQSEILSNEQISVLKKQAMNHAVKDYYPNGMLTWFIIGNLPQIFFSATSLIDSHKKHQPGDKKLDGIHIALNLGVPGAAFFMPVNLPEKRIEFFNQLSENQQRIYLKSYSNTIKMSRLTFTIPIIIFWLKILTKPMVVYD